MDHPECTANEPVLVVDDEAYGPATEEAFACVLLVREEPTKEETELLLLAAEVGYVIEPRVVGKAWRYMEEGNFFPLGPPIEPGGLLGEG